MSTNNLGNPVKDGDELKGSDVNQFRDALNQEVVGREDGIPTAGQDLGTDEYPWGTVRTERLNISGNDIDFSQLLGRKYAIIDGPRISGSDYPQLISTPVVDQFTVQGRTRPIRLLINGRSVVIDKNIQINPTSSFYSQFYMNNRKLAIELKSGIYNHSSADNDFSYSGFSAGMKDVLFATQGKVLNRIPLDVLSLDGSGASLNLFNTERNNLLEREQLGCYSFGNTAGIAEQNSKNNREFFIGRFFKEQDGSYSFTDLLRRHLLLNGAIAPLVQYNLFGMSNSISNPSLNNIDSNVISGFTHHVLMWIFIDADNPDIPFICGTEPYYGRKNDPQISNTAAFFDLESQLWSIRTSGSTQGQLVRRDVLPIGIAVGAYNGTTDRAQLARSFDFTREYKSTNTISIRKRENGLYESKSDNNAISVYGHDLNLKNLTFRPNEDRATAGKATYFYITHQGVPIDSSTFPVYRPDLRGYYHPSRSWRCVGHTVKDRIGPGFSYKYSNQEKYRMEYQLILNIGANNSLTLTNDLDRRDLGDTFSFKRPYTGAGVSDYGAIEVITPLNLFFKTTNIAQNISIEIYTLGGLPGPIDGGFFYLQGKPTRLINGGRTAIVINFVAIDEVASRDLVDVKKISNSTTGQIKLIIQRPALDRQEKLLFNELST